MEGKFIITRKEAIYRCMSGVICEDDTEAYFLCVNYDDEASCIYASDILYIKETLTNAINTLQELLKPTAEHNSNLGDPE